MILIMKVSWIKYEKDNKSFSLPEKLGFDVFKCPNCGKEKFCGIFIP